MYRTQVIVANAALLLMAMLVAIQFRLELPFGRTLGEEYRPYSLGLPLLVIAASVVSFVLAVLAERIPGMQLILTPHRQMRILLLGGVLLVPAVWLLIPNISQLQLIYFLFTNVFFGLLMIVLPARLRLNAYRNSSVLDDLRLLRDHFYTLQVWLAYRIRTRYAETVLGVAWIVLFPLATSLVLAFAMTYFLGARSVDVPFVPFLLSGQVIFMIFNSVVQASTGVISGSLAIIKQVYFPREILILLAVGETLVDFVFLFIATIIIGALYGIYPNIYFVYIPFLVLMMTSLTLGVAFIVSWLSLRVRDIAPLTGVALQLLFYVTVFFSDNITSEEVKIIRVLNPLSGIVEAFRDIVLYGHAPDISSLYAATALSFALVYLGYVYFKVNEDRFADYT
jgi:lipopolysaccharide transport system permease protein